LAWEQESTALQALDDESSRFDVSRKVKYASTEFSLNYYLSRKWYLTGRYEYRWRNNDNSITSTDPGFENISRDFTATSNNVSVGISYVWKAIQR